MSRYSHLFTDPQGPGDKRPTALDIVSGEHLDGKFLQKVALVTGCSSGIGVETARALHAAGAHVYMTARDIKKAEEVKKDILSDGGPGKVDVLHLDLGSLESVRSCAAEFLRKTSQLHILVLNAGVMACPEGKTKDGFETQFGTNHLAHFLLAQLLTPTLLASSSPQFHSRVVSLSSLGHRWGNINLEDVNFEKGEYSPFPAYSASKSANSLFALEMNRRYADKGLNANSVHPGGIMTNLARHMDEDSMKAMITDQLLKDLKSPAQGAATSVWGALSPDLEGCGGKYLENCSIGQPVKEGAEQFDPGFAAHIFDQNAAKKLWDLSDAMVNSKRE